MAKLRRFQIDQWSSVDCSTGLQFNWRSWMSRALRRHDLQRFKLVRGEIVGAANSARTAPTPSITMSHTLLPGRSARMLTSREREWLFAALSPSLLTLYVAFVPWRRKAHLFCQSRPLTKKLPADSMSHMRRCFVIVALVSQLSHPTQEAMQSASLITTSAESAFRP